ncbi:MAG: peptidylprolyl isomerase [Prevotella sp.]|nr:peptidylprolyl isomerase [Prevotella sp.]MBR3727238.1 peptidylprolyl isomerase [Prevotella sp.]MBR7086467.1 peptidylprolyl isomerase [Prevotella sp.]
MKRIILIAIAALQFAALDIEAKPLPADSAAKQKSSVVIPETSIVDEVIWVVGDEPILKSEVEALRQYYEEEKIPIKGDPYCYIPEQIAMQKLFLHQAAIDSIEVTESEVMQRVDEQVERWIQLIGSQEKLEEYQRKSIAQIRRDMRDDLKNTLTTQKMREKLVEDVTVTPSEVRRYFQNVPEDSVPFVPTEVEVEIITQQPRIAIEEINRVKNQLREYTERITKGETTFATLARLYSEDGSARQGGELGYMGRGSLDPAFANVAFNLTDPKKVSKIVESEFGFHIIQLIDKRGDRINCRHIILKPQVSSEAVDQMKARLDSIANDIRNGLFTFENAATLSDDKDTRNNRGLMSHVDEASQSLTSRFSMKDLPTEVARVVDTMKVGEISKAFTMINSRGKLTTAIVKLVNRIEAHRANITNDYQVMKNIVLAKRREEVVKEWMAEKIKRTYVRINDRYKNCDFEYQGWVK